MSQSKFKYYISSLPKVTGLVFGVSVVLSVLYDWAYFAALDLSMAEVPSSINDHIRSSLLWFPGILITYLIMTVYFVAKFKVENAETGKEKSLKSALGAISSINESFTNVLALFALILFLLLGFQIPKTYFLIPIIVLYCGFWTWAIKPEFVKEYTVTALVTLLLPMLLAMNILFAYSRGERDILKTATDFRVVYKDKTIKDVEATYVRHFDKFLVIGQSHKKQPIILFNTDILRVEKLTYEESFVYKGILGELFGINLT